MTRIIGLLMFALCVSGCVTWLPGVREASSECAAQAYGGQQAQSEQRAKEAVASAMFGPILGGLAGLSPEEHKAWQAAHAECMTAHGFPPGMRLYTR